MNSEGRSRGRTLFLLILQIQALAIGSMAIIAGGYDDSPGLQGIGLILIVYVVTSFIRKFHLRRKVRENAS